MLEAGLREHRQAACAGPATVEKICFAGGRRYSHARKRRVELTLVQGDRAMAFESDRPIERCRFHAESELARPHPWDEPAQQWARIVELVIGNSDIG
jgi:hypothetical protein